jgi:hypothetical protein
VYSKSCVQTVYQPATEQRCITCGSRQLQVHVHNRKAPASSTTADVLLSSVCQLHVSNYMRHCKTAGHCTLTAAPAGSSCAAHHCRSWFGAEDKAALMCTW